MDHLRSAAADAQRMYERLDNSDSGKRHGEVCRERDKMEWRVRDRFEEVWEDVEKHHRASTRQRREEDSMRIDRNSSRYPYEQQQRPLRPPRSGPPDDWQSKSQAEILTPRHEYQTREVRPAHRRQQDLPLHHDQGFPDSIRPSRQDEPVSHQSGVPAPTASYEARSQNSSLPPCYDTALAESRRAIEAFLNDEYDPPPAYSSHQDQPRRKDRRKKKSEPKTMRMH